MVDSDEKRISGLKVDDTSKFVSTFTKEDLEEEKTKQIEENSKLKLNDNLVKISDAHGQSVVKGDVNSDSIDLEESLVASSGTKPNVNLQEAFNCESSSSIGLLTSDTLGLFTLSMPLDDANGHLFSQLKEDVMWFDSPVSMVCVKNSSKPDVIEVKFKEEAVARTVLKGLTHKYPLLRSNLENSFEFVPDKTTGLFTLCFSDIKQMKFKLTLNKFKQYSKYNPIISRGFGGDQVFVAFHQKDEAMSALKDNISCEDFPELHIASVSREKRS